MTRKSLLAALSAGLLFGAAQDAMAADAPKPPKPSNSVLKPLQAIQTANNKKDYPAALHVHILGINGLGKVYALDRNFTLTR